VSDELTQFIEKDIEFVEHDLNRLYARIPEKLTSELTQMLTSANIDVIPHIDSIDKYFLANA
jgi:hypothetical protein